MHKNLKKQNGIVLISCIIFLVLILMLLKVSLSSSSISEKKSGINQEILTAQESAQLALRDAEINILSVISPAQLSACGSNGTTAASKCHLAWKSAIELAWLKASLPDTDKAITNLMKNFKPKDLLAINQAANKIKNQTGYYYTGKSGIPTGCKDSNRFWQCVKWNPNGKAYMPVPEGITPNLDPIEASNISDLQARYDIAPKYVVERFLPNEVDMPADASILFRITAVGFGQSGGSDKQITYAVFQANYTL